MDTDLAHKMEQHLRVAFNRELASVFPRAVLLVEALRWDISAHRLSVDISVNEPDRMKRLNSDTAERITLTIIEQLRHPFRELTEKRYRFKLAQVQLHHVSSQQVNLSLVIEVGQAPYQEPEVLGL